MVATDSFYFLLQCARVLGINFLAFQLQFLHLFRISFRRNVKTIPNDIWYRDLIIWAHFSFRFNVSVAFYFSFTLLAQLHLYVYWCIFWLPNMIWALLSFLFLWKYRVPFRLAWTKFAPNQETWNQFAEICHFQFVHVH